GPSSTGRSGRAALTAWTTTSDNSDRNERQANTMADDNNSQDAVRIERSFDAPVDLIWEMGTDPEHFAAWYGPDGATIPVARMDVRVGGTRLVGMEMQTPNGPTQRWFTGQNP